MSSGCSPNHCWIITWPEIEKIVPKAAGKFEKAVGDILEFNRVWCEEDREVFEEEFSALDVAFGQKTSYEGMGGDDDDPSDCLRLAPLYYYEDLGDIYDTEELRSGPVFQVLGVEEMTPSGEKFAQHLTEAFWVKGE